MLIHYKGLSLSPIASQDHKQLIYLKLDNELMNKLKENKSIKFQIVEDDNIRAYVDPSQLSYHNFENILNLDSKLENVKISFDNFKIRQKYYQFDIIDHDNVLLKLHQMNLYTLPFNNKSRGGKRMIFSSINLSDVLTKQFKDYQEIASQLKTNFNSINHVFRLNSFAPSDTKFHLHYDTPFADNQRKLYSKYTMLIYLTGGSNQQYTLKIDDQTINQIQPMTCIIFDQNYEHEGYAYQQNQKVFIRTQLIYHDNSLLQSQQIAEYFNKACYFTKQSIYDQDLQKYANELFNHTAKLRYSLNVQSGVEKKILLVKKNFNVIYMTDGHNFWFRNCYQLKLIAKLILMDYFNAKLKQKIHSKQYKSSLSDDQTIISYLDNLSFDDEDPDEFQNTFNKIIDKDDGQEVNIVQYSCGLCRGDQAIQTSVSNYRQAREISLDRLHQKLKDMSVVLFNQQLYVRDQNIIVTEKEIEFNDVFLNKTINFASCQCETYPVHEYIKKQQDHLSGFLLPSIPYKMIKGGYKLSIDIFKNGFYHRSLVQFSKPVTVHPQSKNKQKHYEQFYNKNEQYIDSEQEQK